MILADTNCLLLLAGLDKNEKTDVKKLESFVSDKEICITSVSIFELLNNRRSREQYSFVIHSVISKCKKTIFLNNSFFNSYFNSEILIDLEQKSLIEQEKAKKEIAKAIIDIFTFYYSNLFACAVSAYFIIFNNFDDRNGNDDEFFKKQTQLNFDLLEMKLNVFLSQQFRMMILTYRFNEKTRKSIVETLYFGLIKEYAKIFNKMFLELDKDGLISYEILFRRLISITRKINIEKVWHGGKKLHFDGISLFESLTKQLQNENDKNKVKEYITKIALTLSKFDYRISPYMNKLFESNLCSLMFEKAKFNDNDLLDSLILDYMFYSNTKFSFEGVLTFDKKLICKAKKIYPNLEIYDDIYFSKREQ